MNDLERFDPITPGDTRIDHRHLLMRVAWLEGWLDEDCQEDDLEEELELLCGLQRLIEGYGDGPLLLSEYGYAGEQDQDRTWIEWEGFWYTIEEL